MAKVPRHTLDAPDEPAPAFASDAEIKLAEQLRHRIEERYLAAHTPPTPLRPAPARSE
jgi:hypothetical protein